MREISHHLKGLYMFSGKARFQSKNIKEKAKDTGILLMTNHEMGHFKTWKCVRERESNGMYV